MTKSVKPTIYPIGETIPMTSTTPWMGSIDALPNWLCKNQKIAMQDIPSSMIKAFCLTLPELLMNMYKYIATIDPKAKINGGVMKKYIRNRSNPIIKNTMM